MWIHFQSRHPFAIKVFIGGVNAISGEHEKEDKATDLRRFRNYKEGKCIQEKEGTPFEQQKLFWGSKQLELHKTLREHNVYEVSYIQVFLPVTFFWRRSTAHI